jgi:hypothetical protein
MPHLYSYRKGWESENIARYLLSRFSFTAHPSTVSDDIGSDFYCTLFQTQKTGNKKYLIPKNSFAIQIKSNIEIIDMSDKISYLVDLELPFFVGVIDRDHLSLSMYSGENLPMFFSLKGDHHDIKNLSIELSEIDVIGLDKFYYEKGKQDYVLRFPKISDIKADFHEEELKIVVDNLCEICSFIQRQIASKNNFEYIFDLRGTSPPRVEILAGVGSMKFFRENFFKRLAEVFKNLQWLYYNYPARFKQEEFTVYETFYYQLQKLYGELPPYVTVPFHSLLNCLEESNN